MWTEQADELRSDLSELGMHIAEIHAAAWRARVDPDATGGLAGAATALFAPTSALWSRGQPMPSDRVMIGQAEDSLIAADDLHRVVVSLHENAYKALRKAETDHRKAVVAARQARSDADRQTANADANAARDAIADCELALETTSVLLARTGYAIKCLERVPEDLAEVYEVAYRHLRRPGARLPADGDFLTPTFAPQRSRHATPV